MNNSKHQVFPSEDRLVLRNKENLVALKGNESMCVYLVSVLSMDGEVYYGCNNRSH